MSDTRAKALAEKLARMSPEERAKLKALLKQKKAAQSSPQSNPKFRKTRIPKAPTAEHYPLSHAQQRLAVIQQMEGSSRAYHLGGVYRLRGVLDLPRVEAAIHRVVARHESLRTQFEEVAGELRQRVLPVEGWRGFAVELKEVSDLSVWSQQVLDAPLDLAVDALFSTTFARETTGDWGVVLKLHHIIGDGASIEILQRDIEQAYAQPAELASLERQYRDYAVWARDRSDSAELEPHRQYWQQQFADLPEPLVLNTDAPRPKIKRTAGDRVFLDLDQATAARLEKLGQAQGATPFMTWLATVYSILGRWGGQSDLVIGTPVAGRELPELREPIGLFVNTLPVRINLKVADSFGALVRQVKETVLAGVTHQAIPFDRLVDDLKLERDTSRSPLFDVMMGFEASAPVQSKLFGLPATEIHTTQNTSKVDLTFHLKRHEGGLRLDLEFATSLFSAATMSRLAQSWETWVKSLLKEPNQSLAQIQILSAKERDRVLVEFNRDAQTPYPHDSDIVMLFREQVANRPEAVAVQADSESLTYAELERLSDQVAHHLREIYELRHEELVVLAVARSPQMVVGLLGILKSGAAYLPLNLDTPAERAAAMVGDAGCRVVLHDEAGTDFLKETSLRRVDLSAIPVVYQPVKTADIERTPQSLAYAIFTSGSTGQPKGTLVEDRAVVRLVQDTNYARLDETVRILQTGSLAFDASTFEIWGALLNGGCLCLPRGNALLELDGLAELLCAHSVNTVFLTTGLFNQIVEFVPEALAGLRTVLTGGEKVSLPRVNAMRRRSPELDLVHVYGPTENTTFSSFHRIVGEAAHDVPIGGPIANSTLYVLDEQASPVPVGVTGEIHTGGDGLARGYLNRPRLTAEKFVPDPYTESPGERLYRTGDLGYWNEVGQIVFVGRTDDQVKIRGFRVELGEIETVLRRQPGIQQAVVVAQALGGTHELVAYVVADHAIGGPTNWRTQLGKELPHYMIPAKWMMLPELPLNANGKVDRRRLPEPNEAIDDETELPPEDFMDDSRAAEIALIWRQVLGVGQARRADNFFTSGGDSIKAIQLVARVRQGGHSLKLTDVFSQPTLGELIEFLNQQPRDSGEAAQFAAVQGVTAYTAVQRWFLEAFPVPHDRFCQTVLLQLPRGVEVSALRAALADVFRHHDALRSFVRREGDEWHHEVAAPDVEEWVWENQDWTDLATDEWDDRRTQATEKLLNQIDLARGRLMATGLFRTATRVELFWAIHHWAVDGLSWRILAEDLQAAYVAHAAGREPELPARTAPLGRWADAWDGFARSERARDTRRFWETQLSTTNASRKRWDRASQKPKIETVQRWSKQSVLAAPQLNQLGADVRDVLLSSLADAWSGWTDEAELALTLEGHGREGLAEGPPIERTVGWFTSLYPVLLPIGQGNARETLHAVRAELARLPQNGSSFLPLMGPKELPGVSFNYLGEFGAGDEESPDWQPIGGKVAAGVAPHLGGPFGIDLVVTRQGDALEVRVFADPDLASPSQVETLLSEWQRCLEQLGKLPADKSIGPADVTLAGMRMADWRSLIAANGASWAEIVDVMPLTPMQGGLLFQYLQNPDARAYCDLVSLLVEGPLERSTFDSAWVALLETYPNLRARFWHKGAAGPVQVIMRQSAPDPQWHDVSDASDVATAVGDLRSQLAAQGFDLARAEPLRLDVVRLAEDRHEWIIRFHHIALDGWSSGLIMAELQRLYVAELQGRPVKSVVPRTSFADYLKRQQDADVSESLAFWRDTLLDAPPAAEVPPAIARMAASPEPAKTVSVRSEIAGADYRRLQEWAGDQGVTLSAVLQSAWALLLGQLNATRDVVFGVTVSGREGNDQGVNEIVGLLINTLPLRSQWSEAATVLEVVRQTHQHAAELQEHAAVSLADLQAMSGAGELFTHTLIFENYPETSETGDFVDADGNACTWRTEVVAVEDPMHFEFGLLVAPGADTLGLRAVVDPELFPQNYTQRLLGGLMEVLVAMVDAPEQRVKDLPAVVEQRAASIVVSATYTAEPILPVISFWGRELSLPLAASCADFNQVFQDLLGSDQSSTLRVVLARFEDWLPETPRPDESDLEDRLDALADDLVDALRMALSRGLAERVLVVVGPSREFRLPASFRGRLQRRMEELDRVEFWWGEKVAARHGCSEIFDPEAETLGAIPFQDKYYAALGTLVARIVDRLRRAPVKLVATDADETLWQGIVGEAGRDALSVPPLMRDFQQRLVSLEQKGCLLAVASKNEEKDVRDVLAHHPDMQVREDKVVAVKANWQPKAENLRALAGELNLGADSFVFIDDNPVELAEMAARFPEVSRLSVPRIDEVGENYWSNVWLLDADPVASSGGRTQKYREHAERESVRSAADSMAAFRASLDLQIDFEPLESDWNRASELTLRTNQFHAAPRRMEASALQAWAKEDEGHGGFIARVKDRFGDYGQCGLVLWEPSADSSELQAGTFLLSCRAMGRGVEHAMLRELAKTAEGAGQKQISLQYVKSDRNRPVRDWMESLPGTWQVDASEERAWIISVAEAARVEVEDQAVDASKSANPAIASSRLEARTDRSVGGKLYEKIAREFTEGKAVLERLRQRGGMAMKSRSLASAVAPQTAAEQALHEIWQEVLGRSEEEFGVTDDFFGLGGHSLKAVQVLSRFDRAGFGEIGLAAFFADPTIRGLAGSAAGNAGPRCRPTAAPAQATYPLSRVQRRFWVMEQARGEGPSPFHMTAAFRLGDRVDPARLQRAWVRLVQRHESLRTHVVVERTEVLQRIESEFTRQKIEITENACSLEDFRAKVKSWSASDFDFVDGPLWRVRMDRIHSGDWGLAFCLHHMIADGWSLGIMAGELSKAYAAHGNGTDTKLDLHYKDFAWQEHARTEHPGREFWHELMRELPTPLELPTNRPRPTVKSTRGATLRSVLDKNTWTKLSTLGQAQGATPFAVALTLLRVLVCKQAGVTDTIIGTPVAGRDQPEWEPVVGCFVNLLPLRTKIEAEDTFADVLAREAANSKAALTHQTYPFDDLVSAVAPQRDPSRAPLFDVLLAFQNTGDSGLSLGDAEAVPVELESVSSQYDWTLNCFPTADGELEVVWEYDKALFDEDRMRWVAAHWGELARTLAHNPGAVIGALPHMSAAEKAALDDWGRQPSDCHTVEWNLVSRFAEVARRKDAALAVSDAAGSMTYAELLTRAGEIAAALRAQFRPRAIIGVMGERNREWVATQLGIMGARMIYVPVDAAYPIERQKLIVLDSGLQLLIRTSETPSADLAVASVDAWALRQPSGNFDAVDSNDPAYVIYTSGSTGRPKGVEISHGAFAAMIGEQVRAFGVSDSDVVGQFASMSFDAAMSEVFLALMQGAHLSLAPDEAKQDLTELAAWLHRAGVSTMTLPPALVRTLPPESLVGLHTLITAGEEADRDVVERYRGKLRYINAYGPTEASVCATVCDVFAEQETSGRVPIGSLLPSTAGRVVDELGRLSPIGVPGELLLLGPTLTQGYRGQPERTAEAFGEWIDDDGGRHRFYRTGDRCVWNPQGQLIFAGRGDDQVKLRGFRIELGEIEVVARRGESTRDVLAVVETPENQLVLYGLDWDETSIADVWGVLRAKLPGYMVPADVVGVSSWPLTVNGKVDRVALRAQRQRRSINEPNEGGQLSDLETLMADLWRSIIGEIRIDSETDFFRAGGDSIRALAMISQLRERGYRGSLADLFRDPRLTAFAATLTPIESDVSLSPTQTSGRLSPIQQWFFAAHPGAPWSHFNQVVALRIRGEINLQRLGQAWTAVGRKHPLLRARFQQGETPGRWQRTIAEDDLSWPSEAFDGWSEVEAQVAAIQQQFDLAVGPLVEVVAGRVEEEFVVVLVGHHLVVDWVSWRQLLVDWEAFYRDEVEPESIVGSDDFGHWVDDVQDWVVGEGARAARETWRQQNSRTHAATSQVQEVWPRPTWGAYGEVQVVGAEVSLPHEVGSALRDRILAAWMRSLASKLGGRPVSVELESHGRRFSPAGRSIESAVGWFTALYPVVLAATDVLGDFADAASQVGQVVAAQNQAGDTALALAMEGRADEAKAECALGFNFLGSFDGTNEEGSDAAFELIDREIDGTIHPQFPRDHALDLTAYVLGGRLLLRMAGPLAVASGEEMQTWLDGMAEELEVKE